jgi:hypothetical protein
MPFKKKLKNSHDIQLIPAGYHNNKRCEEGEFQKMEYLHFTGKISACFVACN